MRKFRFTQLFAVALVAVLALAACTSKTGPTVPPKTDPGTQAPADPTTTFKYLATAKPTGFDPAMVTDVPTMQILQNVYSGLVDFNEKGEVVMDLASEVKVSDDKKTYTFTLKDAKFHDGSKVTAEDFKRSMLRAMNPALLSPVADTYLDDIVGYGKFLKKKGEIEGQMKAKTVTEADGAKQIAAAYADLVKDSGIVAKDEKTLSVTIDEPKAFFLAKMTYPTSWVLHKSVPNDKPIAADQAGLKLAIGTGPFKADSYVDGSKFTMKRFADFYGQKAKVGTVEMPIIEKDAAQVAAYRSGENHVSPIPPVDYPTFKADATLSKEIVEWAGARVNYFALNQEKLPAAKDAKVRQAFNLAVDKEKLNQVVFSGTQAPAYGVLPDSIPGALSTKVQGGKFDATKAKELLKDAGYGAGLKALTFKLTYRANNETQQRVAEFVQNQIQTNLGIKLELDPMEWGKLLSASQKKTELDSFLLGWSADYIDPQNFLTVLLHTGAPYNRYGYTNKDFDGILDKADRMDSGAARWTEYSKAEQIAVTDAAWVPTTFAKNLWVIKPTVKGFRYNAMGILPLNFVEVTK